MNTPSLRTRVVTKTAKVFWIITVLSLALTIWLFYSFAQNDSVVSAILGIITATITFVVGTSAVAFTFITKGSRRIDEAFTAKTSQSRRGVVLDETDYQNK